MNWNPSKIQAAREKMLEAEAELLRAEGWLPDVDHSGLVYWSGCGTRLIQAEAITRVWRPNKKQETRRQDQ